MTPYSYCEGSLYTYFTDLVVAREGWMPPYSYCEGSLYTCNGHVVVYLMHL